MDIKTLINTQLNIRESYELPPKLMEIYESSERTEDLLTALAPFVSGAEDILRDYFHIKERVK